MRRALPAVLGTLALGGCGGIQAVLDPQGYAATRIADLWWLMFSLGAAVWLVVVGLAVHVFFTRRAHPGEATARAATEADARSTRWVVGGVLVSLLILVVVFLASLLTGRSIEGMARAQPLLIEVIGHQWWWEVRYQDAAPSRRFETANEIHIPAGEPVRLELRSNDVVHSFWVPNLTGKTDLVPGRANTLWVRGEQPGVYRGQCAQFCGMQHAKMALMVVVHSPEEYRAWAARQLAPAAAPAGTVQQVGQQVFLTRGCVLCHAVRGTPANADAGPDLTHLASRLTLAAGTLPNTRGHLAGWISNPQVVKPGNRMPRVPLDSEELQSLLAYLESLR